MAKWGEGDPRWIVEERPDAINVNNWHWTEKDASSWSIDKIKALFNKLTVESKQVNIIFTEVDKCTGEASVNNRKGKLIFFYEWAVTLKWRATLNASNSEHTGKIEVNNISEENNANEFEVIVVVDDSDDDAMKIKKLIEKHGSSVVRQKLEAYVTALKEEFTQGMILPKREDAVQVDNLSTSIEKVSMTNFGISNGPNTVANTSKRSNTATITHQEKFQCTAQDIYNALTKIDMVQAFTQAPAKLELCSNGIFEFFNGNIVGTFVEITPPTKLVQRWRSNRWPSGHYSLVTITIEQKTDYTIVDLVQTGVPQDEVDSTKLNWQNYYWIPIKTKFGFGSFIL